MLSNHLILCHPLLLLQCNPPQTWSTFLFSLPLSHLLQEVFFDLFYLSPHVLDIYSVGFVSFPLVQEVSFQHIFKMKFLCIFSLSWASQVAQMVKCLPAMRETQVQSLGREDPLEKEMATHSSTLAWKIPWMEEPGRLQSTGSQRIGHHWETSLSLSVCLTKTVPSRTKFICFDLSS